MDENEIILYSIIFSSSESETEKQIPRTRLKRKRNMWVRDFYKQRENQGAYNTIVRRLAGNDAVLFKNYMRMTPLQFEKLSQLLGPDLKKQTCTRLPLSVQERLALTIRYLASGDSQRSIAFSYVCSPSTVHNVIKETTAIIWKKLKDKVFVKFSNDYFKSAAEDFENMWQFPNCLGAIDGKHVQIEAPKKSGSNFFNYKKTHSIVLLATCDANYEFTMCDIGAAGRQSDGGIFRHSEFGKALSEQTLNIPVPSAISERHTVPYVFVADDAFPLSEYMMKPFPGKNLTETQRIFNYRLSRVRRLIENTFGILVSMWRIFRKPIIADVMLVETIIGSCVCLHNWLRKEQDDFITPGLVDVHRKDGTTIPGSWRYEESALQNFNTNIHNATSNAKEIRNTFADYFVTEGSVPWQINEI